VGLYRAEMTNIPGWGSLPTSSKVLCAVYGAIAIAALIATWSQNAAYVDNPGGFLLDFLNDSKVTPASRSLTVDIVLFFLAAGILMVVEARKHGVRFVWAYIAGGFAIAISVTFPLFLIARELRVGRTETTRLGAVDTALLAVFAIVAAGLTIWVDMG
jgi:Terpene cyclase DEP1